MGESKRQRKNDSVNSGRAVGRPRKVDGPRVPYDEIDRLLVHGEVVPTEGGKGTAVVFPSHRELARRYGCSHSLIATYSKKHNCQRRRAEATARVAAKADQKLVELRATALALSKDDALRMIDTYLAGFEKALADGRVRYENPTDFNTMLRLKEFIMGGADSRQEVHAALSLEDIQARHQRMLRTSQQASIEERGEVLDALPVPAVEDDRADHAIPPPPPTAIAAGEVVGQFREGASGAGHGRASRRDAARWDEDSDGGGSAPHGANVAPWGPTSAAPAEDAAPVAEPTRTARGSS